MPKYYTDPWETIRNKEKRRRNKRNRETNKMLSQMGSLLSLIFLPITILVKLFSPKKRR